ncbi:DUF975 family protein [Apilactobacillus xinyiensis]|uniref:DUF975 family protein n=1 Tax=Apilactobacillus xinyiensis TaxID=2841032 RepID=A0ABT0I1G7_9LACO|nr:DUF975 family protein [Apilactobacillus xinyiensis]MCK8624570.1 DUF975 family protein [Apilactobacillus xinyiensis]MCL0312462.1 DUF975 family protein [Apilactobacillus xinyiensis]MCL0318567.1 DUF975 family protein [Apilactobacillus xinyiensis]
MSRFDLKKKADRILMTNFKYFFLMFLPYYVLAIIASITSQTTVQVRERLESNADIDYNWGMMGSNAIFSIVAGLILTGIAFVCIDHIRNKTEFEKPFSHSVTIINNSKYFWGTIFIGILSYILTVLWTILLIIPGIIKSLAYSQAIYIYRDAADKGEHLSYMDAITKSRQLMDGHKWEFFVLQLSFIGWHLLVIVTFGLAALYVTPYYNLTMANFYDSLLNLEENK